MPSKKDITGQRFGRLVALQTIGMQNHCYIWECVCDCGNTTSVPIHHLLNGHTQSCGCLRRERYNKASYSHGHSRTRLYRIWGNMKTRCTNPRAHNYHYYGGKGISVCYEWKNNFQAFYDWAMANGYAEGLVIDRIDSDGDYCPENCRWITQSVNATAANNQRWLKSSREQEFIRKIEDVVPEGISVVACEK